VFVAPASITNWPVVADASSFSEDAIVVGDAAVEAMSVTTPSPELLSPIGCRIARGHQQGTALPGRRKNRYHRMLAADPWIER
jgi:hypothetical protein